MKKLRRPLPLARHRVDIPDADPGRLNRKTQTLLAFAQCARCAGFAAEIDQLDNNGDGCGALVERDHPVAEAARFSIGAENSLLALAALAGAHSAAERAVGKRRGITAPDKVLKRITAGLGERKAGEDFRDSVKEPATPTIDYEYRDHH
ncbi:MAG: hypothetical protein WDM84_02250 [Bauldia sp.]